LEFERPLSRRRLRLPLKLPIRVVCKESTEYEWTETSRLIDVNQLGAGFVLTRPVEVGRLLHLTIPMPHTLRCYDQFEQAYSVWALVRHVASLAPSLQAPSFRVGVGFVGKYPPLSFEEDPARRYEPLPPQPGRDSMWKLGHRPAEKQRRETRLIIPLEVMVETMDESGIAKQKELTVTETLSSLGACVPTNLDVEVGRVLRIRSLTDHVSLFAAIRSRVIAPDGIPRLGLEFIGGRWPLHKD
jgi:hypothetical protein